MIASIGISEVVGTLVVAIWSLCVIGATAWTIGTALTDRRAARAEARVAPYDWDRMAEELYVATEELPDPPSTPDEEAPPAGALGRLSLVSEPPGEPSEEPPEEPRMIGLASERDRVIESLRVVMGHALSGRMIGYALVGEFADGDTFTIQAGPYRQVTMVGGLQLLVHRTLAACASAEDEEP